MIIHLKHTWWYCNSHQRGRHHWSWAVNLQLKDYSSNFTSNKVLSHTLFFSLCHKSSQNSYNSRPQALLANSDMLDPAWIYLFYIVKKPQPCGTQQSTQPQAPLSLGVARTTLQGWLPLCSPSAARVLQLSEGQRGIPSFSALDNGRPQCDDTAKCYGY